VPSLDLSPELTWFLGGTILLYVVGMYGLALAVRSRIHSTEDFLVAGRRLPLSLAWATLLATWFGAGTILAVTQEVTRDGLRPAALDPIGAGFCLIIAGLFFARPLWKMGLLTLSDFYRRRFGPRAEILSACILVPSYFGWVAAQLVALAGLLELLCGIDFPYCSAWRPDSSSRTGSTEPFYPCSHPSF
jgi:Na+/proline symporter